MSRSGYSEDYDDIGSLNLYRANVERAIKGKRGQAFLTELLAALDAMPEKRLIAEDLIRGGEVCAIGSVGVKRGMDMTEIEPSEPYQVAQAFGIARALASEIEWMNDEVGSFRQTPEDRWTRMRAWVASQILVAEVKEARDA